jgi:hypothetical protein
LAGFANRRARRTRKGRRNSPDSTQIHEIPPLTRTSLLSQTASMAHLLGKHYRGTPLLTAADGWSRAAASDVPNPERGEGS